MSPPDPPPNVQVPLSWVGYDEAPIVYANQLLVQFLPEEGFVVGIGQATAPPLTGSPEEIARLLSEIEFIPVRTLLRVALTRPKLGEFIAALEANRDNFDRTKDQLDPRGQE
jgi:hypothetical protein